MLENEPQGGERDGSTPPVDDAAPATPARRTRAPRRKAAAPPAEIPTDAPGAEPGAAIEAAAARDALASGAEPPAEAAPPVKAVRSRRKAVAAAAPAVPPADEVLSPADPADPADPTPVALETTLPVAPVKAVRARRKKAAAPAAELPSPVQEPVPEVIAPPEPLEAEEEEPTPATLIGVLPLDDQFVEEQPSRRSRRAAALPPAVLFMPPEAAEVEPAPRRSRRGATALPSVTTPPPAATAAAATPAASEISEAEAAVADLPVAEEPTEGPRRSRRRRRGSAAEEPAEAVEAIGVAEPVLDEPDESSDDVEEGVEAEDDEDDESAASRRRRRRGRRGRGRGKGPTDESDESEEPEEGAEASAEEEDEEAEEVEGDGVTRRRRRRRRKGSGGDAEAGGIEDGVHTVVRVREPRSRTDEVQGVSGSTRLEAKRQRRRDGREQRRTRPPILSESEFLARREAVDRVMVVRQKADRTQIAVLEDDILVEHYVARATSGTMVGNVYLGKVQNVLPSMEAAFVDVGRGRNAVLYAGEVNWDATGLEGRARSIETALKSGDPVLVQVTKDPIGHKGARLSSHIALSGRHLVYVPNGNASGISRKLPDNERKRLRDVLKKLVPDGAGVIVRTAAEGASEDELARDVKRLQAQWEEIQRRSADGHAPAALSEEPDLVIRVVRDLFNEDFRELIVQGEQAYGEVENYLNSVSPDLVERLHRHVGTGDIFVEKRIDEQILKGLDRKVFLPSGGHLVIDRTEAMTVVDVNTGKYTGAGGNLEETVTRNNLEAAEEIVRQLRLRDLGGIVVIDFIDMVLESNRELVLRRLTECLGRDRTKHQVTEITSLGLVQMTRKRIGSGLLEVFSETCDHCKGRGLIMHTEPVAEKRSNGAAVTQVKAVAAAARPEPQQHQQQQQQQQPGRSRRRRGGSDNGQAEPVEPSPIEPSPIESAPIESAPVEPAAEPVVLDAPVTPVVTEAPVRRPRQVESPAAITAGLPPSAGSGIIGPGQPSAAAPDGAEYDISGYDLSRYEAPGAPAEPLRLTGTGDPDAAEDEDDEEVDGEVDEDGEPVGAGAGGRRRSRRSGARRRTRP